MTRPLQSFLLLASCALVWGSSFILMKKSLPVFPPAQVATLRFALAGLLMLPLAVRHLLRHRDYPWKHLMATSLLGNFLPSILFPLALTQINSATGAILNALSPLFSLLIGVFVFRLVFRWHYLIGVVAGFLGATLLFAWRPSSGADAQPAYGLLVLLASVCYAANVHYIKTFLTGLRPLEFSSLVLFTAALPSSAYLLTSDVVHRFQAHPDGLQALGCIALLALFGTALTRILFFLLLQRAPALFASTVTYLIPIVATGWGWLDGEPLGLSHVGGLMLILSGVALVNHFPHQRMHRLFQWLGLR